MIQLHKLVESVLISGAKCEEAEGRRQTWAGLARYVAADPDIAEAYALLSKQRAQRATVEAERDSGIRTVPTLGQATQKE